MVISNRATAEQLTTKCVYEECSTMSGKCLQRPVDDTVNSEVGAGGNGDEVQKAFIETYQNVINSGIAVGGGAMEGVEQTVLAGLNNAISGSTVPNSEGVYYCMVENININSTAASNSTAAVNNAFYWVLNCDVLNKGYSGDESLCNNLTSVESALGNLGYAVDKTLFGNDLWNRYVFNETTLIKTSVQPIESGGFMCNERPWFRDSSCVDPLSSTCAQQFEGTTGTGEFQYYGDVSKAVVAQDVREWQLQPCRLNFDPSSSGRHQYISAGAIAVSVWVSAIHLLLA